MKKRFAFEQNMYTYVHCILSTPIHQQTPNLLIFEEKVLLGPFEV